MVGAFEDFGRRTASPGSGGNKVCNKFPPCPEVWRGGGGGYIDSCITSPRVLSCRRVLHYFLTMPVGFNCNLTFGLKLEVGAWHHNCHCLETIHFPSWVTHSHFDYFICPSSLLYLLVAYCKSCNYCDLNCITNRYGAVSITYGV